MDIDDGRQAAREFATDNEAEESSDSDNENSVWPTSDKSEDEKSEGEYTEHNSTASDAKGIESEPVSPA